MINTKNILATPSSRPPYRIDVAHSLYGMFNEVFFFCFTLNESDKYVYYKVVDDDCIFLCLYVDDILLFESNIGIINETKSFLCGKFEIKYMCVANVILGLKLSRSVDGIVISQSHYVEKTFERFNNTICRSVKTPYD